MLRNGCLQLCSRIAKAKLGFLNVAQLCLVSRVQTLAAKGYTRSLSCQPQCAVNGKLQDSDCLYVLLKRLYVQSFCCVVLAFNVLVVYKISKAESEGYKAREGFFRSQ